MAKALVSLTFDDGLRCQLDRGVPILDQHGLPATFFVVANDDAIHTDGHKHPPWNKVGWGAKDVRLLNGMAKRGHEVGSHSLTHRYDGLTARPDEEAAGSKRWIEERLGLQVTSYCYPFSHVTDTIKKAVVKAGYHQARGGSKAAYYPLSGGPKVDLFDVDCRHVSAQGAAQSVHGPRLMVGTDGVEDVCAWARPGRWHVLMFHGIGTINDGWWPISLGEFARQMGELAKLRDSGAVDVVTFKDGAELFRE